MRIESKNNEKIKQAVHLAVSAKERSRTGLFFLEGLRLCVDAAQTGIRLVNLFYTEQAAGHTRFHEICEKAENCYEISDEIAAKLARTQSSQGIFCICEKPSVILREEDILSGGCFIALENIQDPANLGAICRTAEALGIKGAVISGCCDLYNAKSQRAAMGSLLRLPVMDTDDLVQTLENLKSKNVKVFSAVAERSADDIRQTDFSGASVTVIGNEANGVTREVRNVTHCFTVPMKGRAESLNASSAAAIIMWEIIRRT